MNERRKTGTIYYVLHRHDKSLNYICVKSRVTSEITVISSYGDPVDKSTA